MLIELKLEENEIYQILVVVEDVLDVAEDVVVDDVLVVGALASGS